MDEKLHIPSGSIYKYTDYETALKILRSTTFMFTCPLEFNDPFDCNPAILEFSPTKESESFLREEVKKVPFGSIAQKESLVAEILESPSEFRKAYRHIVDTKIKYSGVTCFSKHFDNTLLWSHYADQHKGVCLEFDSELNDQEILCGTELGMFVNVDYEPIDKINYNKDKRKALIKLFSHKSEYWKYEEEVRLIVIKKNNIIPFTKKLLTGVIFGCRMDSRPIKDVKDVINEIGYSVTLIQAIKGDFELSFREIS